MNAKERLFENVIKYTAYSFVLLSCLIIFVAVLFTPKRKEAYIGDFSVKEFNTGWVMDNNNTIKTINLPSKEKLAKNTWVILDNKLPASVDDGMTLRIRGNMADVFIYIDGELRESYSSEEIGGMPYYLPSAYVMCDLHEADAGKDICIKFFVKGSGKLSGIVYGYGNNPWFEIIKENATVVYISALVAILGVLAVAGYEIIGRKVKAGKSLIYLGFLMITVSSWILSETHLRQIIFKRPSLSSIFAYITIELIGTFAAMYFDDIQNYRHHKIYVTIEAISVLQVVINSVLHFTGVVEYYKTLIISHVWMGAAILLVIINLIRDIAHDKIKEYFHDTIGLTIFLIACIGEIANFYIKTFPSYGVHLCIGLLAVLISTIVQLASDTLKRFKAEEVKRQEMTINTMETIASAIDAKDEYTGGHSYRVSEYAFLMASYMARELSLVPRDIMRIRYIGLLHDIGKIAIAENILNKAGKLTDEEFALMKKHTIIGYELLRGMDDVPWLLDGINYHHERFDGKGYPEGLAGNDIPLVARILGVADAYDAMTSNRIYRQRLSDSEVRNEIERCAGTQFDPEIAKAVVKMIDEGVLRPITESGYETSSTGIVLKSSILENILRHDLQGTKHKVLNPGSIKMVCYIAKLSEKKRHQIGMYFLGVIDENGDNLKESEKTESKAVLNQIIDKHIETKDVAVEYTESRELVVLFNRDKRESQKVIDAILEDCKGIVNVKVTEITKEMVET